MPDGEGFEILLKGRDNMKKISTLYKKDNDNLSLVTQEVNPANAWVFDFGVPTRKFDGTACMILNGELYKRYDAKEGWTKKYNKRTKQYEQVKFVREAPKGAIPCQEKDPITGHHPHWVKCNRLESADKWYFVAFDSVNWFEDGTYECCGPHFQNNAEHLAVDTLIKHGSVVLDVSDFTYDGLKTFLSDPVNDIEGIVFQDASGQGRMCKIRKCDFNIER